MIDSPTRAVKPITSTEFKPFPSDQIQCAIIIPGPSTRIALVNDNNKLFILRPNGSRWVCELVYCKLGETRRLEVGNIDEKLSMAATDNGTLRMFWMEGTEGRLLSIDITDSNSSEAEKILTPF